MQANLFQVSPALTSPETPDCSLAGQQSGVYFDGLTYEPAKDKVRLNKQLQKVYAVMQSGQWKTLAELSAATGEPEASVSARLRDLRKPRFGGWLVNRRRRTEGTFEYQVTQ